MSIDRSFQQNSIFQRVLPFRPSEDKDYLIFVVIRNLSGYYETDFPDWPPHVYNFTAEELETDNVTISDQGTKVRVLNYNESVEIVFQETNDMNSGETHPMHLHGFRFYIIGMGVGNFDNETDPQTYNLQDPPEANTLALPKDGWATIRFRADNPGKCLVNLSF